MKINEIHSNQLKIIKTQLIELPNLEFDILEGKIDMTRAQYEYQYLYVLKKPN